MGRHLPGASSRFLLSQMKNNEESMQSITHLGHDFRDVHLSWVGPVYPILRLVHPNFIAPLLQASGISQALLSSLLLLLVLLTPTQTNLSRG